MGMSIYLKILDFKDKVGAIKKDKQNDHFKSSFANINTVDDHISPVLKEVGLAYVQNTFIENEKPYLKTIIFETDQDENNDKLEGVLPLISMNNNDPQKLGSSITYMRRYALVTMLSLSVTDDDGEIAAKPQKIDDSIGENDIKLINRLIEQTSTELNKFLNHFSVAKVEDLRGDTINKAITMLQKKAK